MKLVKSLFSKSQDPALAAAAQCWEQNKAEVAWVSSLTNRSASSLHGGNALAAFKENPSEKLALEYVKEREHCTANSKAFEELHHIAIQHVPGRIEERTRPVLKAALQATVARIEAELRAIQDRDIREHAASGWPVGKSHLVEQLSQVLNFGKTFLERVDKMKADDFHPAFQFIFDDSIL